MPPLLSMPYQDAPAGAPPKYGGYTLRGADGQDIALDSLFMGPETGSTPLPPRPAECPRLEKVFNTWCCGSFFGVLAWVVVVVLLVIIPLIAVMLTDINSKHADTAPAPNQSVSRKSASGTAIVTITAVASQPSTSISTITTSVSITPPSTVTSIVTTSAPPGPTTVTYTLPETLISVITQLSSISTTVELTTTLLATSTQQLTTTEQTTELDTVISEQVRQQVQTSTFVVEESNGDMVAMVSAFTEGVTSGGTSIKDFTLFTPPGTLTKECATTVFAAQQTISIPGSTTTTTPLPFCMGALTTGCVDPLSSALSQMSQEQNSANPSDASAFTTVAVSTNQRARSKPEQPARPLTVRQNRAKTAENNAFTTMSMKQRKRDILSITSASDQSSLYMIDSITTTITIHLAAPPSTEPAQEQAVLHEPLPPQPPPRRQTLHSHSFPHQQLPSPKSTFTL